VPTAQILIDVDPTVVQSGPILLTLTGLSIGLAVVVAMLLTLPGLRRRGIGDSVFHDVAVLAIPLGLIAGRVFHVADNWTYYGVHPFAVVEPGGFSLGAAILVGGLVAMRQLRQRGVSVGRFIDALAPGVLASMIVGTVGSLLSGDLLGRPSETFLAVKYVNPGSFDQRGLFVYPVAGYLILWFILGALVYRFLARRSLPDGVVGAFALLWLGVGQFWEAFFRSVPSDLFGLSQGQVLGLILASVAVIGSIRQVVRHRACTQPERAAQPSR
jgi:prolipoprotein diacylglyceryltransferase